MLIERVSKRARSPTIYLNMKFQRIAGCLCTFLGVVYLNAQPVTPSTNDATPQIQQRLDQAARTGDTVILSSGHYLIAGSLRIPKGVTLQGSWTSPHHGDAWQKGTTLLITGGRGQESGRPAIEMESSSSLSGVTLLWPEQRWNDIQAYPWAIHGNGHHVTIENVTLINAYQGIWVGSPGSLHLIRNVFGCVLRRGILVDETSDIGRIENVHWNPHYWLASSHPSSKEGVPPVSPPKPGEKPALPENHRMVRQFVTNNLEGFIFGRSDWEYVLNTFVWGAKDGYHFIKTSKGACNGQFSGIGADYCRSCVQIDAMQPYGLQISNGEFTAFAGDPDSAIVTAPGAGGAAQFVNCNFWGIKNHSAWLQGTTAVTFSSCHFFDTPPSGVILAERGKLIVQGCTFDKPGAAVVIGKEVRAAVIMGNLQEGGFKVENAIGTKAQIGLNETP
jgi:hypothetical protein